MRTYVSLSLATCLAALLAACGVGLPSDDQATKPLALSTGAGPLDASGLGFDPASGRRFVPEPGSLGESPAPSVRAALWGREVDVYALSEDGSGRTPVLDGLVVGPELASDGRDFEFGRSLATGHETLTVLHPVGSAAFGRALELAQAGLVPLSELQPTSQGAAIVLVLDDLVAREGVAAEAAELVLASQGVLLATEASAATSHGAFVDGVFHSSRVLLRASDARGFLFGTGLDSAGAELRIPTTSRGALRNLAGRTLGDLAGGDLDAGAPTRDLTRSFRIDSAPLMDQVAPAVLGRQRGQIVQVRPTNDPTGFVIQFQFTTTACAVALQVGDSLRSPGHVAEVLAASSNPSASGLVSQVRVRLITGSAATYAPIGAELRTPWNPALGAPPACYVRFVPVAQALPDAQVSKDSEVRVSFTEPMDPTSIQSTGTFRLAYGNGQPRSIDTHVVGNISAGPGLDEFGFQPSLPLRHAAGQADVYTFELDGFVQGVSDLAGNKLADDLPDVVFTLDPAESPADSAGRTLTFDAGDEDGDGAFELRGGLLYDLNRGEVRGRPVVRFSSVLDGQQPLIGVMPLLSTGLQAPLSPFGSKTMTTWRYIDMGFGLLDPATHDLDVEGMAWAPFAGQVVSDQFGEFRMALAHGHFLPDEAVSTGLLPLFRFSGVVESFDQNLLSPADDPLTVVHAKSKGYTIDPADAFQSATGTTLVPWPMNRNVPLSDFTYWTWRDTSKAPLGGATGGGAGQGADPQRLLQITGQGLIGFYPQGEIPTIGLPLLTEFRCYPDSSALGLNGLQTSFAINSSFRPTFRAHSTGGVSAGGTVVIDPDNEPIAQGGVNPNGGATNPTDNTVYHGQADFVVRVSRGHTRWLELGSAADFGDAVVEVGGSGLPAGTDVLVDFRGATSVSSPMGESWRDAAMIDPYGNAYSVAQVNMLLLPKPAFSVSYFPDAGWHSDVQELDGAQFVQARITVVGNAETGTSPSLAGIGLAYVP